MSGAHSTQRLMHCVRRPARSSSRPATTSTPGKRTGSSTAWCLRWALP